MGLLSKLFIFSAGAYAGAYASQNYDIPRMPSLSDVEKKILKYVEQYRKDGTTPSADSSPLADIEKKINEYIDQFRKGASG
uniref:Uncharacterized protein n=1 Tax=Panagrolaimus sp. PS1159 TaxID=55785 RepID=A0AC35GPQ5_9BILA